METLVFDVDDTLYDQLLPFTKALHAISSRKMTNETLRKMYAASRKHSDILFHENLSGRISLRESQIRRVQRAGEDVGIEITREEAEHFQEIYELEQGKITLFPEIEKLFHLLHTKKQLAVLTNGPAEHQWKKIDQLQLNQWIPPEHIFVSEAIGAAKPEPEAFLAVEKQLQLDKAKTTYIGDSFENDMVGAKQVKWSAIWMNHRSNTNTNASITPDKTASHPKDLLEFFNY